MQRLSKGADRRMLEEDEIYKKLEEARSMEMQNEELRKKLDQLEEENYWQARKAKELNDALFDAYPKDKKLMRLLSEKEEKLLQKQQSDKLFFENFRDALNESQKKIEEMQLSCQMQLEEIRKREEFDDGCEKWG